jgi:hypothetical protein
VWRVEHKILCIGSLRAKLILLPLEFSMPKMTLALHELKEVALHSNSNNTSKNAPQVVGNCGVSMQNNQWEIIEGNLPTNHFFESKGILHYNSMR